MVASELLELQAIDFSVGVSGEFGEEVEGVWEHVFGDGGEEICAKSVGIDGGWIGVVEDDFAASGVVDGAGLLCESGGGGCIFNFAEFDAVAGVFDLVVASAVEEDFAALIDGGNVAGAVDDFGVMVVEGILGEGLSGALGVVPVAHGE